MVESLVSEAPAIIPDIPTEAPKPKRQLTEAQRLAFMKGREKRMENIARRKQEKLDAARLMEESKGADEIVDKTPKVVAVPEIDTKAEDFGDKIATLVAAKLAKPKKPRAPRKKTSAPIEPEPQTPPPSKPAVPPVSNLVNFL